MYEVFEHTADLGLRIKADSLERLFVEAAEAFFSVIVANPDSIEPRETLSFAIEGDDREYLLFDWLNELLYTFESRHLLLSRFEVRLDDKGLKATARGEAMDAARHQMEHEVKAITYHGLKLERLNGGWLAEVIVDI
jgi:SHS2 domain-containing protein